MKLDEKIIKWDRHKQACDCDKIIDFPIPKNKDEQEDGFAWDESVV